MRQELIRVNNDNDRLEERLSALEADQIARAQQRAHEPTSTQAAHPQLKIVRLEPEAGTTEPEMSSAAAPVPVAADPGAPKAQDNSPRPMIKGSGQKVYSTHGEAPSPGVSPAKPAPARGGS